MNLPCDDKFFMKLLLLVGMTYFNATVALFLMHDRLSCVILISLEQR